MTIRRRSFEKWLETNDFDESRRRHAILKESGEKGIDDAIMDVEVQAALRDLAAGMPESGAMVIGGAALGAYTKPRYTDDIDVLVSSEADVAPLSSALSTKFKSVRPHALEHRETGVSVKIITPDLIGTSASIVDDVIRSSRVHSVGKYAIRVASPRGLIALKLGRAVGKGVRAMQDRTDIMAILTTMGYQELSGLSLGEKETALYQALWDDVREA